VALSFKFLQDHLFTPPSRCSQVVLPSYGSRVDFINENLYPTRVEFGLLLPGGVPPTVSFAGLHAVVPLVWRRVLSVRHTSSCSYSNIDVAVFGGSR
jgi:hypothetical protein